MFARAAARAGVPLWLAVHESVPLLSAPLLVNVSGATANGRVQPESRRCRSGNPPLRTLLSDRRPADVHEVSFLDIQLFLLVMCPEHSTELLPNLHTTTDWHASVDIGENKLQYLSHVGAQRRWRRTLACCTGARDVLSRTRRPCAAAMVQHVLMPLAQACRQLAAGRLVECRSWCLAAAPGVRCHPCQL